MINLGKYIFGFRSEYLQKIETSAIKRQFFSYNALSLMLYTLTFLSLVAGAVYGILIFENWGLAILTGVAFSLISFLLILLTLFLNMTTQYKDLYSKMTNMDSVYREFDDHDFKEISDEKAQLLVSEFTMDLRNKSITPDAKNTTGSGLIVSGIKLVLILILSIIVANGLEIFIFQKKINSSMKDIHSSPVLHDCILTLNDSIIYNDDIALSAKWMLDMTSNGEKSFILIECKSLLLTLDVLELSLGHWKIFIDLICTFLFLIPFILVKRSAYYAGGEFLKEATIVDIGNSLMFYFLTKRECARIREKIEQFEFNELKNKTSRI